MAIVALIDGKERTICGKMTALGKPCQLSPMEGLPYCSIHMSVYGMPLVNEPSKVTSRRHRVITKYLGADNVNVYSREQDIRLLQARIEELLELQSQVLGWDDEGTKEHPVTHVFKQVIEEFKNVVSGNSVGEGSTEEVLDKLSEIESTLKSIERYLLDDKAMWAEIRENLALIDRMARSDVDRDHKRMTVLTQAEAVALVGALVEAVKKHITDRDTLSRIGYELAGILSRTGIGKSDTEWEGSTE